MMCPVCKRSEQGMVVPSPVQGMHNCHGCLATFHLGSVRPEPLVAEIMEAADALRLSINEPTEGDRKLFAACDAYRKNTTGR